jgi:hypothetical protein
MHVSTYILPAKVTDYLVGRKVRIRTKIEAAFVSVQTAFFGEVVRDEFNAKLADKDGRGPAGTMDRPGPSRARKSDPEISRTSKPS